jgi:hypothetical protein
MIVGVLQSLFAGTPAHAALEHKQSAIACRASRLCTVLIREVLLLQISWKPN